MFSRSARGDTTARQEYFPGDGNHDVHKITHSAESERFGHLLYSHTANEGPVRIQYNCLVPIYAFPGMKLHGLVGIINRSQIHEC
jgi:hypothetical protein